MLTEELPAIRSHVMDILRREGYPCISDNYNDACAVVVCSHWPMFVQRMSRVDFYRSNIRVLTYTNTGPWMSTQHTQLDIKLNYDDPDTFDIITSMIKGHIKPISFPCASWPASIMLIIAKWIMLYGTDQRA